MIIGTLQQNGISEPVAQPQVYSYWRINIGEHFFATGLNNFPFHKLSCRIKWIKIKSPE